tara:strand:- start:42 stop:2093 length:2052 start_codon:yes stop_codon:yes gene_type:complete
MNDEEQLELDLPETQEEQTEEGLEEVIKRNEERNQRDYEENKYRNRELQRRQEERKRQQLDIPGLFEARSGLRTTAALGTEIFLNTLVDPVLEPGTQIAAGSLINALAQRIRGGKFSPGEVTAAGLASLIPGGAQGRALTQVLKGGAKGAASGAIETTGMALVDEGRPPTKEELAAGLGIGFAFGGALSTPGAIKALKPIKQKVTDAGFDLQKALKNIKDETIAPINVALRGDLIGAVADGVGTSSSTTRITPNDPNNILTPYIGHLTNKFRKQPWEDYLTTGRTAQSADRLLTNLTGFPAKLDAPQPKGQTYYTVLKSKGASGTLRGRQPLQDVKDDIDLTDKSKYRFTTTAQAEKSANRFRNKIIRMMQIDRIRGEDAGTLAGFNKGSRKINTVTGGIKDVGETYYDYLTGFFNRYIRRGTVDNFDDAVKIKIPKVQGRQILPGVETDIVQGDASLIRELRLFTMAPDVYKSGAFTPSNPTYQSQVKSLIRKYSTVNKPMTYNARRNIFQYKVDAHHIDQVAEGWPLYRGLPKEEIPKMRLLLKQYDLEPGNHEKNVLFLLNEFHKEYHNVYWPRAYAELRAHPDGWDIDVIREIQTASGRMDYARRYAEAITKSRDEIVQRIKDELDELARIKNKARADLTLQEVQAMSLDIPDIDDIAPPNIAAQLAQDPADPRWRDYD